MVITAWNKLSASTIDFRRRRKRKENLFATNNNNITQEKHNINVSS